jgi:hypothetical protein
MLSDRQTDCRLRANRVTLTLHRSLPVFLSKRTISEMADMSQRCHIRTNAPQHFWSSRFGYAVFVAETVLLTFGLRS